MTAQTSVPTAYDSAQFDNNFPLGIEDHYWFRARNAVLDRSLAMATRRGLLSDRPKILEVGCGTGIVVAGLKARHDIWGVELGHPPRADAPDRIWTGTRAQDLEPGFRTDVEALMMLDVIEHIPDDVAFLRETLAAFPRCKAVFVTVPARPELWSNHDRYYGHFRRYTRKSLRCALAAAGLVPSSTRYMFRSLYAAAVIIKALGRERDPVLKPPRVALLNMLAAAVLTAEDRVLGAMPLPGLSVLAVATRSV